MPVNTNGKMNPVMPMPVGDEYREFWLAWRQSLLAQVDNIEQHVLRLNPTTAEIRRWYREAVKEATLPKA